MKVAVRITGTLIFDAEDGGDAARRAVGWVREAAAFGAVSGEVDVRGHRIEEAAPDDAQPAPGPEGFHHA
jgi:hypothetical protein